MGLRELRRERGWTLEAVAFLTGLNIGTVSRLERGKGGQPGRDTVVTLARTFGTSVDRMARLLDDAREVESVEASQ